MLHSFVHNKSERNYGVNNEKKKIKELDRTSTHADSGCE